MIGIIIAGILILVAILLFAWIIYHDMKESKEQGIHEKYISNPYRIIKNGLGQFCIQNYTFIKRDGEPGQWRWQNLPKIYDSEKQVKEDYCELVAQFKFKSILDSNEEAQKMKNSEKYMKSIDVHEIVDVSDCMDLCEKMISNLRRAHENESPKKQKSRKRKTEDGTQSG